LLLLLLGGHCDTHREPVTKKEWIKERNTTLPTKLLTKEDVLGGAVEEHDVGYVVKDHESAEIAVALDFGEDWATVFWPKLEKLVRATTASAASTASTASAAAAAVAAAAAAAAVAAARRCSSW
jgi:hypothetical protein